MRRRAMYALLVQVEIDTTRVDEAIKFVREFTVRVISKAPGFVSGTWMRSNDGTHGCNLILFEDENAAKAAADRAAEVPPAGVPARFVEIFEVMALA
jgi:hypothetical protein